MRRVVFQASAKLLAFYLITAIYSPLKPFGLVICQLPVLFQIPGLVWISPGLFIVFVFVCPYVISFRYGGVVIGSQTSRLPLNISFGIVRDIYY